MELQDQHLPQQFSKYFWDVDAHQIDLRDKPHYVIERLLEYGNLDALKWTEKVYGKEEIKQVVCQSRRLSPKSANFYAILYSIPRKQIKCLLQKGSWSQPKTRWTH